ncbi:hypothetical protein BDW69DRAFT_179003 [Aspergillus filifer]
MISVRRSDCRSGSQCHCCCHNIHSRADSCYAVVTYLQGSHMGRHSRGFIRESANTTPMIWNRSRVPADLPALSTLQDGLNDSLGIRYQIAHTPSETRVSQACLAEPTIASKQWIATQAPLSHPSPRLETFFESFLSILPPRGPAGVRPDCENAILCVSMKRPPSHQPCMVHRRRRSAPFPFVGTGIYFLSTLLQPLSAVR